MELIFEKKLPSKQGFVEQIDEDGKHYYQPTPEQYEKENQQKSYEELVVENSKLSSKLNASITSNQTLEDSLVEMAGIVYA